ncbi:MAG TPA: protease pro-enzyme activation domain-containing protein, partial [Candidatus Baltobacteraceae bacterium]|nr:protease pro-enzyme activation domain-containing protein [Candidatus Baltobacteraceae bacterium]
MNYVRILTSVAAASLLATTMQVTAAAATANPLFGLRAITSNVDRSRELDLAVHLPLRNQAQLEKLFIDTSNRHSPLYRHWITPAQFAARFGPAPADVSRAILTLKAAGFRIGSVDTQMIHAIAPFATVERVFGTHLVG